MNWKSFLEHLPKIGERILIIHEWEWCDTWNISTKHYTIYECNYKNNKKNVYDGIDMSVVNVANLKMIGGEKLYDCLEKRQFYSQFTHWARLD